MHYKDQINKTRKGQVVHGCEHEECSAGQRLSNSHVILMKSADANM